MDNVRLFTSTPVMALLMSKDGNVEGVEAESEDGEKISVKAEAVIIATGGFANNVEMMKEYTGSVSLHLYGLLQTAGVFAMKGLPGIFPTREMRNLLSRIRLFFPFLMRGQ